MNRSFIFLFQSAAYVLVALPLNAEEPEMVASNILPEPPGVVSQMAATTTTSPTEATEIASAPPLSISTGPANLRSAEGASEEVTKSSAAPAPTPTEAPTSVAAATPSATPAPSPNAMVNLVNLLVGQHVVTREAGDALIKQAEQEAETAKAQIATTQEVAQRALTVQTAVASGASSPSSADAVPASTDEVNVAYVPDVVKNQIRDEVTQNVMKQTENEDFAKKSDIPDWVKRFRVSGDIRVRSEGDFYPAGNAVGSFTNFNAINTGSGYVIGSTLFPQYNVDQDRYRFRLRARLGAEIDMSHGFSAGMRVGTGADNSPVTENQTLGAANNGQGGNFSKYAIWLDRAYLKYQVGNEPDWDASFVVGRFDDPFFHTSMIWSDDLAFDGAAVQAKYKVAEGVTPFFVAGGFPVFNTDLNFSSNDSAKFPSEDKYLLATQVGTNWQISKDFSTKLAGAYYYFTGVEGQVSSPIPSDSLPGNTDDSRPAFAQNGNTYIALRNYQDPTNPSHIGETQYFGLATGFQELAFTGQLDYSGFDPFHMWVTGEFVKNMAFDRNAILANGSPNIPGPINNLEDATNPNTFSGGDYGWNVKMNVGKAVLKNLWDWNVNLGYRYVQTDATIDGFTDSDFGAVLAGTNLQGYTVGGNLALSSNVWLGLRWMSAAAIAGPTYQGNVIQFDINGKF